MNEILRGKVRKLKEGYGFIAGDDGRDYFFHWTAMQQTSKNFRELAVLDRVEFTTVGNGSKGPRAIEIRVINDRPN
jgi:cold shock CspA family protein